MGPLRSFEALEDTVVLLTANRSGHTGLTSARQQRGFLHTGPSAGRNHSAVLAEQHDEWAEGRRYLGLDVLTKSQAVTTTDEEVTDELTLQAITA